MVWCQGKSDGTPSGVHADRGDAAGSDGLADGGGLEIADTANGVTTSSTVPMHHPTARTHPTPAGVASRRSEAAFVNAGFFRSESSHRSRSITG
jgi:hypothetical protein